MSELTSPHRLVHFKKSDSVLSSSQLIAVEISIPWLLVLKGTLLCRRRLCVDNVCITRERLRSNIVNPSLSVDQGSFYQNPWVTSILLKSTYLQHYKQQLHRLQRATGENISTFTTYLLVDRLNSHPSIHHYKRFYLPCRNTPKELPKFLTYKTPLWNVNVSWVEIPLLVTQSRYSRPSSTNFQQSNFPLSPTISPYSIQLFLSFQSTPPSQLAYTITIHNTEKTVLCLKSGKLVAETRFLTMQYIYKSRNNTTSRQQAEKQPKLSQCRNLYKTSSPNNNSAASSQIQAEFSIASCWVPYMEDIS
jgi:hypothetical protein